MKAVKHLFLISLLISSASVSSASALTIITKFMGGAAPANIAGTGNLIDIVDAAARIWEAVYRDPVTITIYFGWSPTGDAGTHSLVDQGGIPNRERIGIILFDNSGAAHFYLDPTPASNEEYRHRRVEYQDLGGGFVNVARLYEEPVGEALGRIDLLSVVVHEMGHALGLCAANDSFRRSAANGVIEIAADLPFAGTVVPLASNRYGITSHFDVLRVTYGSVMAGIAADERRLPSALDILVDAEISGFTQVDLDPGHESGSRLPPSRLSGRLETVAPPTRISK